MRILLVEPDYRKGTTSLSSNNLDNTPDSNNEITSPRTKTLYNDEVLWYPPLGLMKLARFHKERGDEVKFVRGCDGSIFKGGPLFTDLWDRVYITTLFTFHFDKVVHTINFYLDAVGGTKSKIFVGGIMASLMTKEIFGATGILPFIGVLLSSESINIPGNINIDLLPPDYSILEPSLYAINDTYYAYTTRGCSNCCPWCGVPTIEPGYTDYLDIKPMMTSLRAEYGDKAVLRLMDNNVLSSKNLERIVIDLEELGYGRGNMMDGSQRKQRLIDFNQGLDASFLNERAMKLLARLNIRPMRIAFDRLAEKKQYVRALEIAKDYGVTDFSNYMLYNFNDNPKDLYERLLINCQLNEAWAAADNRLSGKIFSYPMRYAPIDDPLGVGQNKRRDYIEPGAERDLDWLNNPKWTKRFIRNIELMKGAAHGAISPTPSLARRTIGESFEEFIANLYMPEELLRNRNKHERRVYPFEPGRRPGTGLIESFRSFIIELLKRRDQRFYLFHSAVSENSTAVIKRYIETIRDKEILKWLKLYLRNQ